MRNCSRLAATTFPAAALLLSGCGESSAPDGPVGLYLLETANGLPVPYTSPPSISTPFFILHRGELLLRRDGTFTLMLDGIVGVLEGTYEAAGSELTLEIGRGESSAPPIPVQAVAGGDHVRFSFTAPALDFVFRRSDIPKAPIRDATYTLTAVNGRGPPLVAWDTVINGTQYVDRVVYDSIRFSDGVFFKQYRAESETSYRPSGDSAWGVSEGMSYGSFTGIDAWLVLRRYYQANPSQRRTDSLAIGEGTLTRVRRFRDRTIEERYSVRR